MYLRVRFFGGFGGVTVLLFSSKFHDSFCVFLAFPRDYKGRVSLQTVRSIYVTALAATAWESQWLVLDENSEEENHILDDMRR